ncbi:MAG: c-type cytochrome [Rubrivivax sp.]|nr:MAG: c-type cytochrome [Rubrivivax sp.]
MEAPVAASDPAAPRTPVTDTMAQRVVACAACHGAQGRSTNLGYFPRIAGKPAGYLYNQLVNFRDGRRQYPLMTYLVDHLTDAYLLEIAEHFAALDLPYPPPRPAPASAPELARGQALVLHGDPARKTPACVQCHGRALTGVQPSIPGLLGLPRDYLNAQMGAWRTGQRHAVAPDCMATIAKGLAPEDIGAISSWLSAQPLPALTKPAATAAAALPMPCGSALDARKAGGAP